MSLFTTTPLNPPLPNDSASSSQGGGVPSITSSTSTTFIDEEPKTPPLSSKKSLVAAIGELSNTLDRKLALNLTSPIPYMLSPSSNLTQVNCKQLESLLSVFDGDSSNPTSKNNSPVLLRSRSNLWDNPDDAIISDTPSPNCRKIKKNLSERESGGIKETRPVSLKRRLEQVLSPDALKTTNKLRATEAIMDKENQSSHVFLDFPPLDPPSSSLSPRNTKNPMVKAKRKAPKITELRRTKSLYTKKDSSKLISNCSSPIALSLLKENTPKSLPFNEAKHDSLRRIIPSTLAQLLDGGYSGDHIIIDCRFPYEYAGGHIKGSINISATEMLDELLLCLNDQPKLSEHTKLIFHCEHSAHRAPRMALYLREKDRTLNALAYPKLFYPEIYVLEGGYSSFFQEYKDYCEPKDYVPMKAEQYTQDLQKCCEKLRRSNSVVSLDGRGKFGRSKSISDTRNNLEAAYLTNRQRSPCISISRTTTSLLPDFEEI